MKTPARPVPRRERGAILFIALIVLVAMSLAGIALMRSVDTNVLIAGNLAFRQGATAGGDWGIEAARVWLKGSPALLKDDKPAGAPFYRANWQESLDLAGTNPAVTDYNWDTTDTADQPADLGFDSAGNRVQYLIQRLCNIAGLPTDPGVACVQSSLSKASGQNTLSSKTVKDMNQKDQESDKVVLYRVTVRITGPRNTVSFVQAVMN
jgi:type IV pilus assembly protein PilX